MRENLAQQAVDRNEVYGRWRIEARVPNSTRKVMARCLDCTRVYEVDLYGLRRKDRNNTRCQACSNRLIAVDNKLAPGLALVRNQLHEYKKNAYVRGYVWDLTSQQFENLIFGDCYYCGHPPSRKVESSWDFIIVNGVDRRNNTVGYTVENAVSCCKNCNYAKRNLEEQEFINLCERVVVHVGSRNRTQGGKL